MTDNQIQSANWGPELKETDVQQDPLTLAQDRRKQVTRYGLTGLLLLICVISLSVGSVPMTAWQTLAILGHSIGINLPWEYTHSQHAVLESIRAPRVVMGMFVGSILAVSGAAMQGLFRNPLADPALIGISSGATLAAVTVIVLGSGILQSFSPWFAIYSLPVAAFIGGFAATWLVYRFATVAGRSDISSLLLAGIAINALAGSATGLLIYLADDQQLRTITFWTMGSLGGASWSQVLVGAPFFLSTLLFLPFVSRALNALLLGEAEAGHLGFSVEKIKILSIFLVALGVGATVSFAGIIGFVGLVVPHLLRLWFGPDHHSLLPCAALLGAILLLTADLLARTIVTPAELPIGIITGILGGPFFLWLLRRQRMFGDF